MRVELDRDVVADRAMNHVRYAKLLLFGTQLTLAPRGGTFTLQGSRLFSPGLFLAEAIQPHDFGTLARLRRPVPILLDRRGYRHGRRGRGCRQVCRRRLGCGIGRLELQAELYRGVEEALDGVERNHQALGNAAE